MPNEQIDINSIIEQNKFIPWVDRIINKDKYPMIKNPDGTVSSHKMAWGQYGDKYVVFPTIEMINGKLVNLPEVGIDPFNHAIKNNAYIGFDTPEQADWFSKNYKQYWGKNAK